MFAHAKSLFALLLTSFLIVPAAQAYYPVCVGDAGGLEAALIRAKSAADTTVIMLQKGTYHVGTTELQYENPFNALKLLGGYDSTCTNRTLNPENTIFDGDNNSGGIKMNGSLTIEGIRLQNFSGYSFNTQVTTPGFYVYLTRLDGLSATIRNNEFIGMRLTVGHWCGDNGTINIDNNLVYGASGNGIEAYSACDAAYPFPRTHPTNTNPIELTGNTVVNNGGKGVYIYSTGTNALYNNIVWNNPGIDIYLYSEDGNGPILGTALLADNTFNSSSMYGNEASGSSGDNASDPLFIDAANGNYRLQTVTDGYAANSPSANSGDSGAPGLTAVDLDGNPRIVGFEPDRGAYESDWDDSIPYVLTVTSAQDSSGNCANGSPTCTLRQAITDANASGGQHLVNFAINDGGSCPWVINLGSDLPYVSASGLRINGFTQTGSQQSTGNVGGAAYGDSAIRCIVLNGEGRNQSMGLTFYGASSGSYQVLGLAFEGWGTALNMSAGQGNQVLGNQFGGSLLSPNSNPDLALSPNGIDIWLSGSTTTTNIGSSDLGGRNIIASAGANGSPQSPDAASYQGRGIAISAGGQSSNNSIVNNLIGMDAYESGTTQGNVIGIQLETASNTISGNIIGNNNNGIQALGSGANNNKIENNRLGLTEEFLVACRPIVGCPPNTAPVPNQAAIYFWQGANTNSVINNIVSNNSLYGIELTGNGTYRNKIAGNTIYGNPASWASNGAQVNLDGYTYGNNPSGVNPNRWLNYPLIDSAVGSSNAGTITGHLESTNDTYSIEVFSSPTCQVGGTYVPNPSGTTTISNAFYDPISHTLINGSGTFSFNFATPASLPLTGRYITATATDSNGNTSEFSACKPYQCDVVFRSSFESAVGETCP